MKKFKILKYISLLGLAVLLTYGCTKDFDEYNKDPYGFDATSVNPAYFVSNVLQKTFVHNRYSFWRGPLIHGDRFADHVRFGFAASWWDDGLSYEYHDSYTNAWWSVSFQNNPGNINELLKITATGGTKENKYLHAVGKICKVLFYQQMTDIFGDIPYSEAGNPDIPTPKYDAQVDIYKDMILLLGEAMDAIGDKEFIEEAGFNLAEGDLMYDGNLQQWKKLANTLRLRLAMRAYGATGADFAATAANACLGSPLLATPEDFARIPLDSKDKWHASGYTHVWWDFSWANSARWTLSNSLVSLLRDNNDPRIAIMAAPSQGGQARFVKSEIDNFDEAFAIITGLFDDADVEYTVITDVDTVYVEFAENTYYVGQPARFNGIIKPLVKFQFFATPNEYVVDASANYGETSLAPVPVVTVAESYFLQAEAALLGMGSGNADNLYKEGIRMSMKQWGIEDVDIDVFLTDEPIATLSGTTEEQIGMINSQRWLANFTNGFEAWTVMRKSGYPKSATADIPNNTFYAPGTVGDGIPYRMRYPSSEDNLNPANLAEAVARQGDNTQKTKLWWAK